jgi:PilZ domain
MLDKRVPVERRKHKRFKVRGDIFAVFGKDSQAMGRIIDISKGGLAFNHKGTKIEPFGIYELSLLFADLKIMHISHASVKFKSRIVSDHATITSGQINTSKRRCAVQFDDDLTWYQHSSLDNLISLQASSIS